MNKYIKELNDYLLFCEERDGFSGIPSMLEFLWECYRDDVPVDDGQIKKNDAVLSAAIKELSLKNHDALSNIIVDVCTAYQRAAFLEGIAVGVRLERELIGPL